MLSVKAREVAGTIFQVFGMTQSPAFKFVLNCSGLVLCFWWEVQYNSYQVHVEHTQHKAPGGAPRPSLFLSKKTKVNPERSKGPGSIQLDVNIIYGCTEPVQYSTTRMLLFWYQMECTERCLLISDCFIIFKVFKQIPLKVKTHARILSRVTPNSKVFGMSRQANLVRSRDCKTGLSTMCYYCTGCQ